MYNELNLSDIKAKGWAKEYINTQAEGMTGHIGETGAPFSDVTWEGKTRVGGDVDVFIGGINSKDDGWVPFEQNAYWIDGCVRGGWLADNEKLKKLGAGKIYPALDQADEDGFIGPGFMKDGISWQHAVYFRALIAEYTATKDERILEAMKKHFLRRPITDVYLNTDWRIIAVRNVVDVEILLWIYGQTNDKRFLDMAEESYAKFNELFYDDTGAELTSRMKDITLKGMLSNRKVNKNHGVTYNEVCKTAAILYKYTGKEIYKKAVINAYDKLFRDQMLIDGVHSSSEYLNGNEDSHAMHETCDVSDFTWALGYLYMITGDTKYSDWVENAIFNGGFASVDDDFKGNQYFSCPNQVIANDTCNHGKFFRGEDWLSYAPKRFLACCAGNVNRFFPNFIARAWMRDGDTLSAFVYAPTEINVDVKGVKVAINEETNYPFENVVKFTVNPDTPVNFTLALRKPNWAVSAKITLNGEEYQGKFVKNVCKIDREFKAGDTIVISFEDKIEFIENAKGVSVKKGALLYALPVKERVVIEGLRELNNPILPHYSVYGESKWNYGICAKTANAEYVERGTLGAQPWRREQNCVRIKITVREIKNWKIQKVSKFFTRYISRGPLDQEVHKKVEFTPVVGKVNPKYLGKTETVELIPYCSTRLRIAIFPKVEC